MYSDRDQLFILPDQTLINQASGKFARRIFIAILHEPAAAQNLQFLSKILTAAGLNLEKDCLLAEVELDQQGALFPALKEKQAEYILVFGLAGNQLGINTVCPKYQAFNFYGVNFLFADPLSQLEPDKTLKAKLWQALQALFL